MALLRDEIGEVLNGVISEHAAIGHSSELAWALGGCLVLDIPLTQAAGGALAECYDPVAEGLLGDGGEQAAHAFSDERAVDKLRGVLVRRGRLAREDLREVRRELGLLKGAVANVVVGWGAGPPQVQGAGVPVADGLLAGGLGVDVVQRERDLDQLLRVFTGAGIGQRQVWGRVSG